MRYILITLILLSLCGFDYKTTAVLSDEQVGNLDQVSAVVKGEYGINGLGYVPDTGEFTVVSTIELTKPQIAEIVSLAEAAAVIDTRGAQELISKKIRELAEAELIKENKLERKNGKLVLKGGV